MIYPSVDPAKALNQKIAFTSELGIELNNVRRSEIEEALKDSHFTEQFRALGWEVNIENELLALVFTANAPIPKCGVASETPWNSESWGTPLFAKNGIPYLPFAQLRIDANKAKLSCGLWDGRIFTPLESLEAINVLYLMLLQLREKKLVNFNPL